MSIADKMILLKGVEKRLADKLTATSVVDVLGDISAELEGYEVAKIATNSSMIELYEYLDMFLDSKRLEGRSEKTVKLYQYVIKRMLQTVNVPIQNITVYHLRRYMMDEKERGLSDRTLSDRRNTFNCFFGWLHKEKLIPDNPCANLGAIKHRKKVRKPFSDTEVELLKSHCECIRDKALIHFLLSTGCRISEVVNLNRDDINFGSLECIVLGKGNKERTVFIDDVTAMLVKRYLASRSDDSPELFRSRNHKRLTTSGVRKKLKKLGKEAGVDNVHPHRFRRTLATNLISRGMPIQEVSAILGHEDINTTMGYVYLDKSTVKHEYRKYA